MDKTINEKKKSTDDQKCLSAQHKNCKSVELRSMGMELSVGRKGVPLKNKKQTTKKGKQGKRILPFFAEEGVDTTANGHVVLHER